MALTTLREDNKTTKWAERDPRFARPIRLSAKEKGIVIVELHQNKAGPRLVAE